MTSFIARSIIRTNYINLCVVLLTLYTYFLRQLFS